MTESIALKVTGMKCGGCEANVSTQLNSIDGVIGVAASSKENSVEVTFDSSQTSLESISQMIVKAGYQVED